MSNERERYNIDLNTSNETGDSRSAGSRVHGRKESEVQTLIKGIHATSTGAASDSSAVDAIKMRGQIPEVENALRGYAGKHRGQDPSSNEPLAVQAPPSVPIKDPIPVKGKDPIKEPVFVDKTPVGNGDKKATNGKGTIAAPIVDRELSPKKDEGPVYSEAKQRVTAAHHAWEASDSPDNPR